MATPHDPEYDTTTWRRNAIGLQRAVQEAIGDEFDLDVWFALEEAGHVRDIISYSVPSDDWIVELTPVQELVNRYRAALDYKRSRNLDNPSNAPADVGREGPRWRREALQRIVAWEAWRLDSVEAFRVRWFGEGDLLNTMADAQEWIESRLSLAPPKQGENRLAYITAFGQVRTVATQEDPALSHLATVSVELARRYRWDSAEAVLFLLTALPPSLKPPAIAVVLESEDYPELKHVLMEIDARASPAAVAEAFRRERNRVWENNHRSRAMTGHHAELAVFVTGFVDSGVSWGEVRAEWNETFPPWAYEQTRKFMVDTRNAYQRVTGRPLEPGYLAL